MQVLDYIAFEILCYEGHHAESKNSFCWERHITIMLYIMSRFDCTFEWSLTMSGRATSAPPPPPLWFAFSRCSLFCGRHLSVLHPYYRGPHRTGLRPNNTAFALDTQIGFLKIAFEWVTMVSWNTSNEGSSFRWWRRVSDRILEISLRPHYEKTD